METVVAKILSENAVVLGAGLDKKVEVGTQFEIWEPGEEILLPETKESLGRLEIVKGHVEVTHVMEKMSIAKTVRRTETRTRTVYPDLWRSMTAFGPRAESYEVEVTERMKVDKTDSDYEKRLVVKVGDSARSVSN